MEPRHPKGSVETNGMFGRREPNLVRRRWTVSLHRERDCCGPGEQAGKDAGMGVPGPSLLFPSKGDFVDSCLGDLVSILKLPQWLKGLLAFLVKPLVRAQGVEGLG